jgi:hypothetical protein
MPTTLSGGLRASSASCDFTVNELPVEYLRFCRWVVPEKPQADERAEGIRFAIRPLIQLYDRILAVEFGPIRLKAVRQGMMDANLLTRSERETGLSVFRLRAVNVLAGDESNGPTCRAASRRPWPSGCGMIPSSSLS